MDAFLNKYWWLKSKKVWALILALVTITAAAVQVDPFPYADYTMKVVALVVGFMGSNALEDGMKARAAATQATTTVSTPGGSDVTVTAPPDVTPPGMLLPTRPIGPPTSVPDKPLILGR